MKINISRTYEFTRKIDDVIESLCERKENLNNTKQLLIDNNSGTDAIVLHISKIENEIDEMVFKLQLLRTSAERIAELFVSEESRLVSLAENEAIEKIPMFQGEINIKVTKAFGDLLSNGQNS